MSLFGIKSKVETNRGYSEGRQIPNITNFGNECLGVDWVLVLPDFPRYGAFPRNPVNGKKCENFK